MRIMNTRYIKLLVVQSLTTVVYILNIEVGVFVCALILSIKQFRDELIVDVSPDWRVWNVGVEILVALIVTLDVFLLVSHRVNEIGLEFLSFELLFVRASTGYQLRVF